MKIKRLYINNYKSLVNFELIEPNPFSVFVGPNAAGKSNVFEALEFMAFRSISREFFELFGGRQSISNKQNNVDAIELKLFLLNSKPQEIYLKPSAKNNSIFEKAFIDKFLLDDRNKNEVDLFYKENPFYSQFIENFSRLFIGNDKLIRFKTNGNSKLRIDCANLEPVLHRLLQDENNQEEIIEWLQLLVPELEKIEVVKSELSGDYYLRVFEKYLKEPIGKNLISDGTYNILALLTAVYQSDEPQFLCIEEPENGLNPYVIKSLVDFFRTACEEKGHYIWLNTHSATLVRELKNEEIILVDKKQGITSVKKVPPDFNRYDLTMDEAWLTNALGGGLPW